MTQKSLHAGTVYIFLTGGGVFTYLLTYLWWSV